MTNQSRELKPCPFCGGEDYKIDEYNAHYAVRCMTKYCWAFGSPRFSEKEAIDAWNTRANTEDGKYIKVECKCYSDGTGTHYISKGCYKHDKSINLSKVANKVTVEEIESIVSKAIFEYHVKQKTQYSVDYGIDRDLIIPISKAIVSYLEGE